MNKSYRRSTYKKKGRKRVLKKNKRHTKKNKRRVGGTPKPKWNTRSPRINIPYNTSTTLPISVLQQKHMIKKKWYKNNKNEKAVLTLENSLSPLPTIKRNPYMNQQHSQSAAKNITLTESNFKTNKRYLSNRPPTTSLISKELSKISTANDK